MKITIVGGGNIGTQFAVHCAVAGHDVSVYTSSPGDFGRRLDIVDENDKTVLSGEISAATDDPAAAFKDAELIFITYPSTMMKGIAEAIYENAGSSAYIGVVPGNGGSECTFGRCIERGNVFFGIERVPAIARLIKKGKTVRSVGYRQELHVAALPSGHVSECCDLVESIFKIPCRPIPNYLNLTMTPSNPILHTTRLKCIFGDYKEGRVYEHLPLFYEEWDDASSELLLKCDDEVQRICRVLPEFRLEHVKSLKDHYESHTVREMTAKICSIKAFKGLKTPSIEVPGGYIPDLNSRYFTADFSYGLSIIRQIAELAGVETPCIDEVLKWYEDIAIVKDEFRYSEYGIRSMDDLKGFYLTS